MKMTQKQQKVKQTLVKCVTSCERVYSPDTGSQAVEMDFKFAASEEKQLQVYFLRRSTHCLLLLLPLLSLMYVPCFVVQY